MGDIASMGGVLIALVGFALTIRIAKRSRTAAEHAAQAVSDVKIRIAEMNTVAGLTSAGRIMEDMKQSVRESEWKKIPDQCQQVKNMLIATKISHESLSDLQTRNIKNVIQQLNGVESWTDRKIMEKESDKDVEEYKINALLTKQIDKITELVLEIQHETGGGDS